MSEKLGPLTFGKKEESPFLGRDMGGQRQDYSEETARLIDAEVKKLILDGYAVAHKLLTENTDTLKKLAEALLEHETIDNADIETIMRGETITRRPPRPPVVQAEVAKEKRPSLFAPRPMLPDEPEKA
jgi:cell division protease FtsH